MESRIDGEGTSIMVYRHYLCAQSWAERRWYRDQRRDGGWWTLVVVTHAVAIFVVGGVFVRSDGCDSVLLEGLSSISEFASRRVLSTFIAN